MHDENIDPSTLGLEAVVGVRPSSRRPQRIIQGKFLRGPIPWDWLAAAGRLPGRALHVGLVLWFWAGRTNAMTVSVSLTAIAKELAFDRSSASRALSALAHAGLVSVVHAAGRKVDVIILDAPSGGEARIDAAQLPEVP